MFDSIPFDHCPFAPVKGLHWEEGLAGQHVSHWLGTETCFWGLWNVKRWITAHIYIVHICTPLRLEVPVVQIPKSVDKILPPFFWWLYILVISKKRIQIPAIVKAMVNNALWDWSHTVIVCVEDRQPPQFRSHVPNLCNVLLAIPANCPFFTIMRNRITSPNDSHAMKITKFQFDVSPHCVCFKGKICIF